MPGHFENGGKSAIQEEAKSSCWNWSRQQCSEGKERLGEHCVRVDVIRHLILQKITESQNNRGWK